MLNYHDYIPTLLTKTYQEQATWRVKRKTHALLAWLTRLGRRWRIRRLAFQQPVARDRFIAVYEFTLKPDCHRDFRQAWRTVTEGIYLQCGSYGSRLHRTDKPDVYVAYAQWPSREQWEKQHTLTGENYLKAREQMRACLLDSQTRYRITVCDDYLM